MEKSQNFESALEAFVAHCQKVYDDYMDSQFPNNPRETITAQRGKRYVKVVRSDSKGLSRCVHCFVDSTNGNVLYAASWQAPSTKTPPRGSIYTPENYGVGPFGANMLKR